MFFPRRCRSPLQSFVDSPSFSSCPPFQIVGGGDGSLFYPFFFLGPFFRIPCLISFRTVFLPTRFHASDPTASLVWSKEPFPPHLPLLLPSPGDRECSNSLARGALYSPIYRLSLFADVPFPEVGCFKTATSPAQHPFTLNSDRGLR